MSGIINSAGSRSGVIGTTELDYEEGDWNYSISFTGSGSGSVNSAYDTGTYVKIGQMVHIQGNMSLSSGSGSGYLSLVLPFVSGNFGEEAESGGGGMGMYGVSFDAGTPVWELPGGGSTVVQFKSARNNDTWGSINFAAGDYFIFSIQYKAAS